MASFTEENLYPLKSDKLHIVLAHSYGVYLCFFIGGVIIDLIFPIRILPIYSIWIGVVLILWATILILWAQHMSSLLEAKKKKGIPITHEDFHKGPYRFTRGPTHVGLSMLLLGFGFFWNSIIIVVLTGIPFIITHFVHLQKMEDILQGKYGQLYKQYKDKVKKLI